MIQRYNAAPSEHKGYLLQNYIGPLPLGEKGSNEIITVSLSVSLSVSNHIFSKTAQRICLILHVKLRCLKGKEGLIWIF